MLITLISLASLAVSGLWWLYATAKCEGFGCIGLGWLIYLLVVIGSTASLAAGALVWLYRHRSQDIPRWLYALMTLNISPLIWLILKMLVAR